MTKLQAKIFQNRVGFYKWLAEESDRFDLRKSLALPYFCYETTDGKRFTSKILKGFLESLNRECDTKILVGKSVNRRNSFIIFFQGEVEVKEVVEEPVAEEVVEEPIPVVEEAPEETVNVPETPSEDAQPDFEFAQGLYKADDKAGSKKALEEYARTFDIELNRGQKFENMMKAFKEGQLDGKSR